MTNFVVLQTCSSPWWGEWISWHWKQGCERLSELGDKKERAGQHSLPARLVEKKNQAPPIESSGKIKLRACKEAIRGELSPSQLIKIFPPSITGRHCKCEQSLIVGIRGISWTVCVFRWALREGWKTADGRLKFTIADCNIPLETTDHSPPPPSAMRFKRVARSLKDRYDQSRERDTSKMVTEFPYLEGTLDEIYSTVTPQNENPIPETPMPSLVTEPVPVAQTSTAKGGKIDTPPRCIMRRTAKIDITKADPTKLSPKRLPPKKAPVRTPMRKAPLRRALLKKPTPKKAQTTRTRGPKKPAC